MKYWYVLNTKPKKESQVERLFEEAGYEVYNPKIRQDDRITPFFAGYAFIRFEFPEDYRLVKYTRGVKKVVGSPESPTHIPEEVIESIRAREVNGLIEFDKYGEEPSVGDEIQIMEGPLKGLKGIFKREMTQNERVLILLNYVSYQGKLIVEKKKLRKVL
ncbi:MAG: transcription termination/antitermination NusG family protein [Candidatus Aminicenantaceae bacterium]|jgi:transcriptional antiterminator RfaH